MKRFIFGAVAAAMLASAGPTLAQDKLTVWWVKGFYKSEDDALYAAIAKYEKKTGVKVDLSQYAVQDMIPKTVAALDAGTPPDVAYADVYDFQVLGKWAYDGKLEDISDVITPIKDRFAPNTIETTFLYNDKTKKKAYYGFPLKQQTMHIEYWIDMLDKAGFKESDIPTGWKDYWSFWCDKVQPGYRKASGTRAFGIGQPMGVDSSDSFYSFLTFMDAYNVKLVDDDGKLLVDDPKVRQGLIGALTDYTAPYTKGCTPPSSTSWKDPDNNVAFHNKTTVMTHNATISIAAKWLDDANNESLKPRRARTRQEELLRAHPHRRLPQQAGRLEDGLSHRGQGRCDLRRFEEQGARQGVRQLPAPGGEPAALCRGRARALVPGHQGGPGLALLAGRPPPPIGVQPVCRRDGDVRVHQELQFTVLNNENVWAKAMNRVVNEKVPVDKAVDELIARIKTVAG